MGQFFRIFEIIIFCFVVAICDLAHDVGTIFRKLQFHGPHSYFRKYFQMLLTLKDAIYSLHTVP